MAQSLSQNFDQAREAFIELGLRLDPTKINPETISGICRMVGEALQCLGLAQLDEDAPDLLPDDLVIS